MQTFENSITQIITPKLAYIGYGATIIARRYQNIKLS